MNAKEYLDRLLVRYAGTFNIYLPYKIGDRVFDAYGFLDSHVEKYILTRHANLWSQDSYEHSLFLTVEEVNKELLDEMKEILLKQVEPKLVLKGKDLPDPNHMYSYMTIVLICNKIPDKDVIKYLKKQSYDKGYMMNIRGFSQAHFCMISTADEKVYTNRAAAKKKKFLNSVFNEVKNNKVGFHQLIEDGEVVPFKQEDKL